MEVTLLTTALFAIFIAYCSSAQYNNNAQQILNASQGVVPDWFSARGHPRGHAIGIATGSHSINSLQDYSRNYSQKTGFASQADQDRVVHLALTTQCQANITALNNGSLRETCFASAANTVQNLRIEEWRNGNFHHAGIMRRVVITMGHFQGQRNNTGADIHIQTAYPQF